MPGLSRNSSDEPFLILPVCTSSMNTEYGRKRFIQAEGRVIMIFALLCIFYFDNMPMVTTAIIPNGYSSFLPSLVLLILIQTILYSIIAMFEFYMKME